ncbi:MAG: hypothetical protein ABSG86_16380 [Thermoguttaceae bacterium]|jgi:hypothetical protein
METKALDLAGIPEPVARGLEAVAELARKLAGRPEAPVDEPFQLPVLHLGAVGSLTREEIYGDYTYRC